MPVEEGYSARVMPTAGAAMPLATPESLGAGLGRALEQVGDTVQQHQLRAYQIERKVNADRQLADFSHKYALHRQNMDGIVQQLRSNPTSPDYAEHVKLVQQGNEAARDGLLAGITEESVLRSAERQLDEYGTQLHNTEADYAESQRVAKLTIDSQQVMDLGANRIRQGGDPQHYAQETQAFHEYVNGLTNVTPVLRDKLLRQGDQVYGVSYINHLNDTNPHAAIALIDAGAFNEVLTPEQIDQARNGAQVEVRRQEAAVERQQAVVKAAFHESVATVEERNRQGIDVSGDLPGLLQTATALGDTSTVEKLKGIARDSSFAKVWSGATPIQRQNRIGAISGIPEAKRSADQQAELKWLQDKAGGLDDKFNSDPVGFVIEHGAAGEKPPPIDWTQPATVAARAQWVRTMVGAYGAMAPLSRNEAAALETQLKSGPGGIKQVAGALSMFGGTVARAAARQVAPGDRWLQHVVTLPPAIQRMAIEGNAARRADPNLIKGEDPDYKAAFAQTRGALHQAMASFAVQDREAVIDAARDIAAYHIRDQGAPAAPGTFYQAMNEALGSVGPEGQRKGGLGQWQGHVFLVPDGFTAQDFTNRVFAFIGQHPDVAPRNPDGSIANLRNAYPVRTPNGAYRFFVGDRVVTGKTGRPWEYRLGGDQ